MDGMTGIGAWRVDLSDGCPALHLYLGAHFAHAMPTRQERAWWVSGVHSGRFGLCSGPPAHVVGSRPNRHPPPPSPPFVNGSVPIASLPPLPEGRLMQDKIRCCCGPFGRSLPCGHLGNCAVRHRAARDRWRQVGLHRLPPGPPAVPVPCAVTLQNCCERR